MGYVYCIEKMEEVLLRLHEGGTLYDRLFNAVSELEVPTNEDLTPEDFIQREIILNEYYAYAVRSSISVNALGEMIEENADGTERMLADKIIELASKIINSYSVLKNNTDRTSTA